MNDSLLIILFHLFFFHNVGMYVKCLRYILYVALSVRL